MIMAAYLANAYAEEEKYRTFRLDGIDAPEIDQTCIDVNEEGYIDRGEASGGPGSRPNSAHVANTQLIFRS